MKKIKAKYLNKEIIVTIEAFQDYSVRKDDFILIKRKKFKITQLKIGNVEFINDEIMLLFNVLDCFLKNQLDTFNTDGFYEIVFFKVDGKKKIELKVVINEKIIQVNKIFANYLINFLRDIQKKFEINYYEFI